jgi:large subunit ribosomal protein L30
MAKKDKVIKITLVRSPIGNSERQKATLRALGLHKVGQTIEKQDSPTVRGMMAKVNHLIQIEEA